MHLYEKHETLEIYFSLKRPVTALICLRVYLWFSTLKEAKFGQYLQNSKNRRQFIILDAQLFCTSLVREVVILLTVNGLQTSELHACVKKTLFHPFF